MILPSLTDRSTLLWHSNPLCITAGWEWNTINLVKFIYVTGFILIEWHKVPHGGTTKKTQEPPTPTCVHTEIQIRTHKSINTHKHRTTHSTQCLQQLSPEKHSWAPRPELREKPAGVEGDGGLVGWLGKGGRGGQSIDQSMECVPVELKWKNIWIWLTSPNFPGAVDRQHLWLIFFSTLRTV